MGNYQADPALHSAEHLLSEALARRFPGYVGYAIRFKSKKVVVEFDHAGPVRDADLVALQREMEQMIAADAPTSVETVPRSAAAHLANLDQVPPDVEAVRVVRLGPFSERACIGRHVSRTGEITHFRLTSVRPVSPGRWRINFVVG